MDQSSVIVWFRDDLRLSDHPALHAAAKTGAPVIALYVLDETSAGLRPLGGAARWWLAQSLRALQAYFRALTTRDVLEHPGEGDNLIVSAAATCAGQNGDPLGGVERFGQAGRRCIVHAANASSSASRVFSTSASTASSHAASTMPAVSSVSR